VDWIYLSPHLDDVALSVGGLLWEQTQAGERVSVWTVCAGDPPAGEFSPFAESLHARWGVGREAMEARRAEDVESCARLGVTYRHFEIPDCIYRRSPITGQHLYDSEESLWVPVHPDEAGLIEQLIQQLNRDLPQAANLVCPLTLGGHVDHRLTRNVAERLQIPLWFYADYPYLLEVDGLRVPEDCVSMVSPISPGGLLAWQKSVAAHKSQISTFWPDLTSMRAAIRDYAYKIGGVCLWRNL
jgi:LmbE family N-acetylglucosaminyl deacetylase